MTRNLPIGKRLISFGVAVILAHLSYLPAALASSNPSKEEQQVQKLKAGIFKLGTGPDARIKLKLKDKTKLEGYISEAGEDGFVVVAAGTGQPTHVAYPQVAQAKGNNLSSKTKLAIVLGTVIAIGVLILITAPKN